MAKPLRLIGVDLSTDPTKTGVVAIDFGEDGKVEAVHTTAELADPGLPDERPGSDEHLLRLLNDEDRDCHMGIDAPFGWPKVFVCQVRRWSEGKPWDADWDGDTNKLMRYRATDRFVQEVGKEKATRGWPSGISVSSDWLCATSRRCAHLLTKMGETHPIDRTGQEGVVIEVYPAAALAHWGARYEGYKSKDADEQRQEVIDDLLSRIEPSVDSPGNQRLADLIQDQAFDSNHDDLDALVCALVVWARLGGHTYAYPDTRNADMQKTLEALEESDAVYAEGWIHHPSADLRTIVQSSPS